MKTHLSADERRAQTAKTVVDLCASDDPATITTGKIANQMRVTQGALFRHFPTKDAIWEYVARWVAEKVLHHLDAAAAETPDPVEALQAMFNAHINFITEHPGVPRIMIGQLQHKLETPARIVVRTLLARYSERVSAKLNQAQLVGKLRSDLNIDAAVTQYIGMVQGLVVQSLITGDMDQMRDQAEHVLQIYFNGILAPRDPS